MSEHTDPPTEVVGLVAVAAAADVRTVRRYYAGRPVRPSTRRRIERAERYVAQVRASEGVTT